MTRQPARAQLIRYSSDDSQHVREAAVRAIPAAALKGSFPAPPRSGRVCARALSARGAAGEPAALDALMNRLLDWWEPVRRASLAGLQALARPLVTARCRPRSEAGRG